jgi:hypothetical protein
MVWYHTGLVTKAASICKKLAVSVDLQPLIQLLVFQETEEMHVAREIWFFPPAVCMLAALLLHTFISPVYLAVPFPECPIMSRAPLNDTPSR